MFTVSLTGTLTLEVSTLFHQLYQLLSTTTLDQSTQTTDQKTPRVILTIAPLKSWILNWKIKILITLPKSYTTILQSKQ